MTDNTHEHSAASWVNAFFNEMENCTTAAQVAQLFTDMRQNLKDPLHDEVMAGIEEGLSKDIATLPPDVKSYLRMAMEIFEEAKNDKSGRGAIAAQLLAANNALLPMSEAFNQVAQARGDKLGNTAKIFVEEAAKLTDEQYNDTLEQVRLMLRVSDRASAPPKPPKPGNPFRKGPAA